ncbi:MAG: hypothetical protein NVSMB9_08460 [Isosphaeraceae bacterium]
MALSTWEILLRLGASMLLGGAIGYERELREQPAGLRTHLLVALASATFALVSYQAIFFQHYEPNNPYLRVDVGRLASNIVVGIGFLGGGAIVHSGATVKGLTTAASLWLVSAVGLAAGCGMFLLANSVTVMTLFALVVLRYVIERPRKRIIRLKVQIDLEGDFIGRASLVDYLKPVGARVLGADYRRNLLNNRSRLLVFVQLADESVEEPLMKRLESLAGLRRVYVERAD